MQFKNCATTFAQIDNLCNNFENAHVNWQSSNCGAQIEIGEVRTYIIYMHMYMQGCAHTGRPQTSLSHF